jgi:hypothetical protein
VSFLVYLPGTWVLAELDIIRLDMVYDSTLLAQNQVTQLFMEDGFKPMRMCSFSRVYSVNICPSGSTGAQRAVACADITPKPSPWGCSCYAFPQPPNTRNRGTED